MGSVYARGTKLWIRFKGPGGWTQRPTDYVVGQERQARALLAKLEERLRTGASVVGDLGPVTVERFYREWLKGRKLEISTWANDEFVFRLHVLPTLGKKRLEEVRASHLVALVRGWRTRMAPKSVWNAYSSLSAFFRDAALQDLIAATPCLLTPRHLGPKTPKDPEFRATAIYTRAELELLISDVRVPMDRRVLYALEGLAGLRHGEAAGLRWRNCSMPAEPLAMVFVAYSYDRAYPKGGRCRPVPVHPTLAALLAEWRLVGWRAAMGGDPSLDDLVVPLPPEAQALSRTKKVPTRSRHFSWDRLEEDLAALGLRHRRGHDLRRTFISLARSDGARSDILRRATHKPPPEVIEGYTHFEWPVVCAEVAKLKVQRRGLGRITALPLVASGLATSLATVGPNSLIHEANLMAHPGLEPGQGLQEPGFLASPASSVVVLSNGYDGAPSGPRAISGQNRPPDCSKEARVDLTLARVERLLDLLRGGGRAEVEAELGRWLEELRGQR